MTYGYLAMESGYLAVLFISIGRMPFLSPTLDNANPLFALVITPGFYLHHVEVADRDPASGSLYADVLRYLIIYSKSTNNGAWLK